jgi:zinc transport system substrate-binding protein
MRSLRILLCGAVAVALGAAVFLTPGCGGTAGPWDEAQPGPKVLAFFPPLYSFAAAVAGPDAQVLPLLTTKGPHDYEFKHADARKLARADLFLVNGLELDDPVADKLAQTSGNKTLRVVRLGESIPKDTLLEGGICHHDHADGKNEPHHHGHDPHVWLGIAEAAVMVEAIRDELTKLDPDHAAGYASRAKAFTDRLLALQEEGKKLLAGKAEKARVMTQHDAMRYFARSFGIEVVDSIELPGKEPSAKRLAELVELCAKSNVRLIAVEPQYSARTGAQPVLTELKRKGIDAAFVELDPMETADPADLTADFYVTKVRQNLDNLAKALK